MYSTHSSRCAQHRLIEIRNLHLNDREPCVNIMDKLISTAGHDWETNLVKCNEICTAFLASFVNGATPEVVWFARTRHINELAADADASVHD